MHSEAATIGEIGGIDGAGDHRDRRRRRCRRLGSRRRCYDFGGSGAAPFRQEPLQMGEAAAIAAELDLVEQLSAANAPFRRAARQIVEVIVGRAGFWRRGAALRRRAEFQPLPDAAGTEPGLSGDVAYGGSGLTRVWI